MGSKRLNFYGQTAIFDYFVRNRHFSSRPFTDKASIFVDLSVNGRAFVKCSARPPSSRIPKSRPKIVYQGGKIKCPQFQPSQPDCTAPKCRPAAPTLRPPLTLSPEICTKKPQLPRCDFSKLSIFPPSRRRLGRLRHECSRPAGLPKTASILPLLQVWPNGPLAFLLQLAGPCEHLLQNRRHSSAC